MNTENIKLHIIQELLSFDNTDLLLKIKAFIEKNKENTSAKQQTDEEPNASNLSFEEWNKQFEDDETVDLNEPIPDYGMTLLEFRKMIWQGEKETPSSYEAFIENQKSWRKQA